MEGTWALPDTPEAQEKLNQLMTGELIVCKCRTSSTEQESVKSSMRGGGREPTTYRTTIRHSTTAPRFQLLSGDEKKVIESMSPSLSLSNFFDSENIGGIPCHCRTFSLPSYTKCYCDKS